MEQLQADICCPKTCIFYYLYACIACLLFECSFFTNHVSTFMTCFALHRWFQLHSYPLNGFSTSVYCKFVGKCRFWSVALSVLFEWENPFCLQPSILPFTGYIFIFLCISQFLILYNLVHFSTHFSNTILST